MDERHKQFKEGLVWGVTLTLVVIGTVVLLTQPETVPVVVSFIAAGIKHLREV